VAERNSAAGVTSDVPVVVAGGPVLAREGIAQLLAEAYGIPVLAHAASPGDVLRELSDEGSRFVALLMTPANGFDAASIRLFAAHPGCTGVIVAGGYRTKDDVMTVLKAGAQGCVSYDAGTARLIEAIDRARGRTGYLCPLVSTLMIQDAAAGMRPTPAPARALTRREREVLALIVEGLTDRQAAAELGLSIKTVHTHRQNIMAKLGVRTATALVRRAFQTGLVVP